MRIAVLADIHGNHPALETCLAHAEQQGADAYWFLGDYLGELPHPRRTMGRLYQWAERHDCTFIRGNKEDYWLGGAAQRDILHIAAGMAALDKWENPRYN